MSSVLLNQISSTSLTGPGSNGTKSRLPSLVSHQSILSPRTPRKPSPSKVSTATRQAAGAGPTGTSPASQRRVIGKPRPAPPSPCPSPQSIRRQTLKYGSASANGAESSANEAVLSPANNSNSTDLARQLAKCKSLVSDRPRSIGQHIRARRSN